MKYIRSFLTGVVALLFIASSLNTFAQAPHQFKYQAIIRDASGTILSSENIELTFSILKGTANGDPVFIETHNVTTDQSGAVSLYIGSKNNGSWNLANVDWAADTYYISISMNGHEINTSQLMSVPYALHAQTAETAASIEYSNISGAPDATTWDDNVNDDFDGDYYNLTNAPVLFDGDYNSLTNKPATITPEQRAKIDFLFVTEATDLDQLRNDVAVNNAKVSFPGFGTTAGTALAGNTDLLWLLHSSGNSEHSNIYYPGKVGVNLPSNTSLYGAGLHVGGGILYTGIPEGSTGTPGTLFYSPANDGTFRYINQASQEKILGQEPVPPTNPELKDQVINKDLIIDGSLGLGQDAVNGEDFGFNTLKLKENNLRILFDDTDTPESGYPYHDWNLTANESSNGGENHFAIINETEGTTPFKVMAGAAHNALYIADSGNIGIGTDAAESKLTVNGTVKANAFVGDGSGLTGITGATGGVTNDDHTLIAADTNTDNTGMISFQTQQTARMTITNAGRVGIGTETPASELEVAGTAQFENLITNGHLELDTYIHNIKADTRTETETVDFDVTDKSVVTFNATNGTITLDGFLNGISGQEILVINLSQTQTMTIKHNGGGTQKIMLPANTDITLNTAGNARFIFDGTVWYCIGQQ